MSGKFRARIKALPAGAFSGASDYALLEVFEVVGEPPDTTEIIRGYAVLNLKTGEFKTKLLLTEAEAIAECERLKAEDANDGS